MTEGRLPIVDGAPACPFVAYEDERDERGTSPDHRHRCYAESPPAPRALAHQEAYCLSSAFPVCPTFQDWARREAARSRPDAERERAPATDGPAEAEPPDEPEDEDERPQRNPPRDWAAPPPWIARSTGGEGRQQGADWADGDVDEDAPLAASADVPRRGRGLSGSYADRMADDEDADRYSIDEPDEPEPDDMTASAGPPPGMDEPEPQARPTRHRERDPSRVAAFAGDSGDRRSPSDRRGSADRAADRGRAPAGPSWERVKPQEAYPTIRARSLGGLSVPPLLMGIVALALAAAVLFALPGLLGFGSPQSGASASPTTPIITAKPSINPTPVPEPTPQTYVVQAGDTLSRIAGRFGVSLADLIAANTETIPDPNVLHVGDVVIIPIPLPTELPAASEIPAAS